MTEREKFERWVTERLPGIDLMWLDDLGEYLTAAAHHSWLAWTASRKEALEEAAQICEKLRDDHVAATQTGDEPGDWCYADGAACEFVAAWNDAAETLRATGGLKEKDG